MRDIKFRVWWKTQSVMAPVYKLNYDFYNCQENIPSTKTLILKTLFIDTHSTYPYKDILNHGGIGWNNPNMMVDVQECELMQFTGLLDKNGVEIYEGDIVRIGNSELDPCGVHLIGGDGIHVVEYDNKRGCFTNTHTSNGLGEIFNKHIEIIGNIYEHSHLLKGE